jgi:hypothetical protein
MRSANLDYEAARALREMQADKVERRFVMLWNAFVVVGCIALAGVVVSVAVLVRWVLA